MPNNNNNKTGTGSVFFFPLFAFEDRGIDVYRKKMGLV